MVSFVIKYNIPLSKELVKKKRSPSWVKLQAIEALLCIINNTLYGFAARYVKFKGKVSSKYFFTLNTLKLISELRKEIKCAYVCKFSFTLSCSARCCTFVLMLPLLFIGGITMSRTRFPMFPLPSHKHCLYLQLPACPLV